VTGISAPTSNHPLPAPPPSRGRGQTGGNANSCPPSPCGRGKGGGVSERRLRLTALTVASCFALTGAALLSQGAYIHAKAIVAQMLIRQAWGAARDGEREARPWPWADTHPVARLIVRELGVDQFVLAHASGRTLAFGPAQVDGSAEPGRPGATVLTGHRDTHFAFLQRLRRGDLAEIELPNGAQHRYRVADLAVVHADRARLSAEIEAGGSWLVLATCWPFDALDPGTSWRYVVTARKE